MKEFWGKLFYLWRFYTLRPDEYKECVENSFANNNLMGLRQANVIVAVLALCFSVFPIVIKRSWPAAGVYFAAFFVALLLAITAKHKYKQYKNGNQVKRLHINALIVLYYANVMFFGIYIGVFAYPEGSASSFLVFIVVALFLFHTSPLFNLCLTVTALTVFLICSALVKTPYFWTFDLTNGLLAAIIGLIFGWQINKYRISAVLSLIKLENERNLYLNQSIIDELTQLKNRRDFTQTFQRYLTNYRSTDDWLCISFIDIDCFKNYNDSYGHQKGDECLRAIGKTLNYMKDNMNVYAARIGGEEFALLWFEKNQEGAKKVISHIHKSIKDLDIHHEKSSAAQYITVSTGVYMMQCGSSTDMHSIYEFADKALYIAKESGRNCTVITGDSFELYTIKPEN